MHTFSMPFAILRIAVANEPDIDSCNLIRLPILGIVSANTCTNKGMKKPSHPPRLAEMENLCYLHEFAVVFHTYTSPFMGMYL